METPAYRAKVKLTAYLPLDFLGGIQPTLGEKTTVNFSLSRPPPQFSSCMFTHLLLMAVLVQQTEVILFQQIEVLTHLKE